LALLRYTEVEAELGPALTRFAVEETVRRMREAVELNWPPGTNETSELDRLTRMLTPIHGKWLAESPSLEDVTQLGNSLARELATVGAIRDVVSSLELKPTPAAALIDGVSQFFGAARKTFQNEVLKAVQQRRMEIWREKVEQINWELFDRGTEAFTWYALEEVVRGSQARGFLSGAPRGVDAERFAVEAVKAQLGQPADQDPFQPFHALREELEGPFRDRVLFWPRQSGPNGDLVSDEMRERVLQVPGWSNIFTRPIQNRVDMLSTGVRTNLGVKVFGPNLDVIDRVCKEIEAALKPVDGARDVLAAPIQGKGYVEIDIDRQRAARYGISIEDIQNEIEVALAGRAVTFTVEQRDRFPVRIRYARANRHDEESIRRLLVGSGTMDSSSRMKVPAGPVAMVPAAMSNPASFTTAPSASQAGHSARPAHAAQGTPLIPLAAVADVRVFEGPAMIKSENGRLMNYVTLNVQGRDMVGFVEEAQRVVAQAVQLPEGVHIQWSGEFEHQVRAARTLRIVFPAVILLIFMILYLTYNDLADAGLMMLAVPEALAGGAFFMVLFPKIMHGWNTPPVDFSLAVGVGFIACFGMATETGIIMLVYLREAIEKRGGLQKIGSLDELRQAVIEGAVHRLRPKLLTEGVAILAIFPMVFATGVGGEILAPMALPVLGGLLISDEVVDLFLPVRFYWVRRARWLKLHAIPGTCRRDL
jgi:Cu(I)/Ag(I) efflux system membrane protein CusA/SilA